MSSTHDYVALIKDANSLAFLPQMVSEERGKGGVKMVKGKERVKRVRIKTSDFSK